MIVLYTILAFIAATTIVYVFRSIIQSEHYTGTVWVETEPSFVPSETDTKIPETEPSFVPSEEAQKNPRNQRPLGLKIKVTG